MTDFMQKGQKAKMAHRGEVYSTLKIQMIHVKFNMELLIF